MLKISFFYEETKFRLRPTAQWRSWLKAFCYKQGFKHGELSLTLGSNDWLLEKNKEHLEHDYYTDILTFDNGEITEAQGIVYKFADLLISVDFVSDFSVSHSIPFEKELARVMSHGVLHLTGFNDDSEENQIVMRAEEDKAVALWSEHFQSPKPLFHVEHWDDIEVGDIIVVPRGTFGKAVGSIANKGGGIDG